MRAHSRLDRRAGFTLVEILVVISLIAVLAALGAGAFAKIRSSQDRSNTAATLSKIHSNLDTKWKVILNDARKTVPPSLVTYCGNDQGRAAVVWAYAKLKNELPETPEEALASVLVPDGPLPSNVIELKPRKAFAAVAAACMASRQGGPTVPYENTDPEKGLTNEEATARQAARESGALLLVALSESGGGGNVMGQDGTGPQVAAAGPETKQLTYYKDSWNQPIGFIRHAFAPEFDLGDEGWKPTGPIPSGTAYTKPSKDIPGVARPIRVSLDPGGKLIRINSWSGTMTTPNPARFAIVAALNANRPVGPGRPAQSEGPNFPLTLDNKNSVYTLVSAGPNRDFGDYHLGANDDGADNVLSIRVRREGARGD